MSITVLDGKRFAEMIIRGAHYLSSNAEYVDALNVFPVPDGDTGTNMSLSMNSGAKEAKQHMQEHIGNVGIAFSKGLLMGARGNSGVILSQLFRGFSKAIEKKSSIQSTDFAAAFEMGVDTAYKAVMKPVEGTILTVAKDAAKAAVAAAKKSDDLIVIMSKVVEEAKASLNRTPELLPVLKEVGVVDSGGQGLVFVYEGFLSELSGESLQDVETFLPTMDELVSAEHHKSVQSHMNTEDIVYGYCTEFMVKLDRSHDAKQAFSETTFRQELSAYGDSLLVIADDELVKVHIHSEQPGDVLTYGQRYGSLLNMKIENMREQHTNIVSNSYTALNKSTANRSKEKKEYGIVTVSMGKGISELFKSIGADMVIEGGQTMNPSTESIVQAIQDINAAKVIILPNNKNIVMTAEQAAQVSDVDVVVIPTKTVPQGMAALLAFNLEADLETNQKNMKSAFQYVKTGQVTFAVRDTTIDGLTIEKDDYMGLIDGKITVKNKDKKEAARELLVQMIDEDSEIVTVLRGEEATEVDVASLIEFIEEQFPDVEVEVHEGGQPLYPFIIAVE